MNEYYYNKFIMPYLKINNIHFLNKNQLLYNIFKKKRTSNVKNYISISNTFIRINVLDIVYVIFY